MINRKVTSSRFKVLPPRVGNGEDHPQFAVYDFASKSVKGRFDTEKEAKDFVRELEGEKPFEQMHIDQPPARSRPAAAAPVVDCVYVAAYLAGKLVGDNSRDKRQASELYAQMRWPLATKEALFGSSDTDWVDFLWLSCADADKWESELKRDADPWAGKWGGSASDSYNHGEGQHPQDRFSLREEYERQMGFLETPIEELERQFLAGAR